MKVAFVTTRPDKASFKFRVAQYLPYIQESGLDHEILIFPHGFFARRRFFSRLAGFDIVFWQKRLLGRMDLWSLRQNSRHLIYDVDDSVMYHDSKRGQFDSSRLARRFQRMTETADRVVVGNGFLGELAARYNDGGKIIKIPSVIDTNVWHTPHRKSSEEKEVTIGWLGSQSTLPYWIDKLPLWKNISRNFPRVKFTVVCNDVEKTFSSPEYKQFNFQPIEWTHAKQVANCAAFDIGVMPLPDNPWTRGKCGFKLIQYLSLGIAAVASPVGVNSEIILHGKTGLLADSDDEWTACLSQLIENREKRSALGNNGYHHVTENYSVQAWLASFNGLFQPGA
ncbi:MAG: glycosyltransferase family 4 protein [Desulfobacterales bacterium]|jgi:glycosyltransferase involved in cell wall biosynthesis|nr:glycosyltransferase family 4 protein [Desulfobacterales bacterium]